MSHGYFQFFTAKCFPPSPQNLMSCLRGLPGVDMQSPVKQAKIFRSVAWAEMIKKVFSRVRHKVESRTFAKA